MNCKVGYIFQRHTRFRSPRRRTHQTGSLRKIRVAINTTRCNKVGKRMPRMPTRKSHAPHRSSYRRVCGPSQKVPTLERRHCNLTKLEWLPPSPYCRRPPNTLAPRHPIKRYDDRIRHRRLHARSNFLVRRPRVGNNR